MNLQVEFAMNANFERIPNTAIVAAEHESTLDFIILAAVIEKPVFVFKEELLNIPLIGLAIEKLGMIDVDSKKYNRKWLHRAIDALNEMKTLVIFPEGKRRGDGEIVPYKKGVFKLAAYMRKSIIPVAIRNTGKLWPKDSLKKFAGKAYITFGSPIPPDPVKLRCVCAEFGKRPAKLLRDYEVILKRIKQALNF
jgi:1-acyl-sn-glycerol-3-phosphate acyltransferase